MSIVCISLKKDVTNLLRKLRTVVVDINKLDCDDGLTRSVTSHCHHTEAGTLVVVSWGGGGGGVGQNAHDTSFYPWQRYG